MRSLNFVFNTNFVSSIFKLLSFITFTQIFLPFTFYGIIGVVSLSSHNWWSFFTSSRRFFTLLLYFFYAIHGRFVSLDIY